MDERKATHNGGFAKLATVTYIYSHMYGQLRKAAIRWLQLKLMSNKQLLIFLLLFNFQSVFSQNIEQLNIDTVALYKIERTPMPKYYSEKINSSFPDFTINTSDNKTLSNKDLYGKIVFINIWQEYCPPCIAELGIFNSIYEKLKDSSNFYFLSLTTDSKNDILKNIERFRIKYPVHHIDLTQCRQMFGMGFPTSFILDKNGKILDVFSGGSTDPYRLNTFVKKFIYLRILEELN